jgi:hypothetical protein
MEEIALMAEVVQGYPWVYQRNGRDFAEDQRQVANSVRDYAAQR